jgi:hypothetical protein
MLDEIAHASGRAMSAGGAAVDDLLFRVIPSVLSPARLRANLKALYVESGLASEFWDDETMWKNFVRSLCALIVWKRVELPLEIVWREIQRAESLDGSPPPYEEPTKDTEADPLNRRAMKYFRRMAQAVGFVAAVPISLQLVPVAYLHRLLKDGSSEEEFQKFVQEMRIAESYPGDGCWMAEAPGRVFFAPFSADGELPSFGIGKNVAVVIVPNV